MYKCRMWKLYSNTHGIALAFVSIANASTEREAIMYHWVKSGIRYNSAEVVDI